MQEKISKELASELADQILNPLTSIQGFSQLLQKKLQSDSKKETELHYLDLILQEVNKIKNFINLLSEKAGP